MNDGSSDLDRIREFYDAEAPRYVEERYVGESLEPLVANARRQIVVRLMQRARGRVLDVGCGPGILTRALAELGLDVVSADLSLTMLAEARRSAGSDRARHWVECELERLPFAEGAFDHVIAVGVLGLADVPRALREAHRILRPGGVLITQLPNPLCPTRWLTNAGGRVGRLLGITGRYAFESRLRAHRIAPAACRYGVLTGLLAGAGFEPVGRHAYDFRFPLQERLPPRLGRGLLRRLQSRLEAGALGWLGEGYVVKALKP